MATTKGDLDTITEVVHSLLKMMGIDLQARMIADVEGAKVNLSGKDSAILIGYRGENLRSFSHILRLILRFRLGKEVNIKVDVAGYLDGKERRAKEIIKKAVLKVHQTGMAESIEGLDSFERRVAHLVTSTEGLESASQGPSDNRVFIIKPKGE